jgi:integrase
MADATMTDAAEAAPVFKVKGIRGFGSSYLRGRVWWIRYSVHGVEHRESTKSERLLDAERLLKTRWKQVGRGRFIGPREDRVTVDGLLDGLVTWYTMNGRRSGKALKSRLKHVRAFFGHMRAVDVDAARVDAYRQARLAEKTRRGGMATTATVNRECAVLRRAFRLGMEQERVAHMPTIRMLREAAPRQGFVEPATFETIVANLEEPLADIARFGYGTGWRREEILSLEWAHVDMASRRVRLRAEHSKNEDPRVIVLTGDLLALMERRLRARTYETPNGPALSTWVFHRQGHRVIEFRTAWRAACAKAKVPGLLFHDLRRSAARNMDAAGVSPVVAMRITGHKTDSMWRRYRIVNEHDIEKALAVTQAAVKTAPPSNVTALGAAREARAR